MRRLASWVLAFRQPSDTISPLTGRGLALPYARVMPCDYCGEEFDPIATRWLCPHCHMKANCCDGAPLAETAVS